MKSTLIYIVGSLINFYCVFGELEFYPDFRRPESVSDWENEKRAEEYALEQFTKYLQEQQRRLALQQEPEPDFTYSVPVRPIDGAPEFAVAPPDPRYYQNSPEEDDVDDLEEEGDSNFEPLDPVQQNQFLNQEQISYHNQRSAKNEENPYQPQNPTFPRNENSFSDYPSLTSNHFQPFQYNQLRNQQREQNSQENPQNSKQTTQHVTQQQKYESQETNVLSGEQTNQQLLKNQQTVENHRPQDNGLEDRIVLKSRTDDILGNSLKIRENDLLALKNGGYRRLGHGVQMKPLPTSMDDDTTGGYIIAVVAGISAAVTVALIAFTIGWYNLQKNVKNASDVEYPAYGVTGPNKDVSPTGDRRLAQSAQMYHYQHQKQQIIAMESRAGATVRHGSMSEAESDEENEEGDYTVYECPGLAPAGEMEVKNPLFQDDPTPASTTTKGVDSLPDQK